MTKKFRNVTLSICITILTILLGFFGATFVSASADEVETISDLPNIADYVEASIKPGDNLDDTFVFFDYDWFDNEDGTGYYDVTYGVNIIISGVTFNFNDAYGGCELSDVEATITFAWYIRPEEHINEEDGSGFWVYFSLDEFNSHFTNESDNLSSLIIEEGTDIVKYKYNPDNVLEGPEDNLTGTGGSSINNNKTNKAESSLEWYEKVVFVVLGVFELLALCVSVIKAPGIKGKVIAVVVWAVLFAIIDIPFVLYVLG